MSQKVSVPGSGGCLQQRIAVFGDLTGSYCSSWGRPGESQTTGVVGRVFFFESLFLFGIDFGLLWEELLDYERGQFFSVDIVFKQLVNTAQLLTEMKVLVDLHMGISHKKDEAGCVLQALQGLTDAKDPRGAWCYVEPGQCSDEEQSMVFPQHFLSYKVCSYLVDP